MGDLVTRKIRVLKACVELDAALRDVTFYDIDQLIKSGLLEKCELRTSLVTDTGLEAIKVLDGE